MGLFNKKKNSSNGVVWRDANGQIVCPAEKCPQKCDNTCPIFLNTEAMMLRRINQADKTIPIYEKVLAMAPDFYEAWNNLGLALGLSGEYQRAYDCYIKAHELKPERPNPVFGLALASKDMQLYEECIKWCDEYVKLSDDHRTDGFRKIAEENLVK